MSLGATSGSTPYPTAKTTTVSTTSGGSLSAASGTAAVASASISNGTLTMTPLKQGTSTITVTSAATSTYKSCSATYALTVDRGGCTVSFTDGTLTGTSGTLTYAGSSTTGNFKASTTSNGALSVSSSNTNAATAAISNGTVTATWVGAGSGNNTASTNIVVTSAQTDQYNSCSKTYTLTTAKAACPITVKEGSTTLSSTSVVALTYPTAKTLTATSSCGNAVTISSGNTSYVTVSGKTLTPVKATSSDITMTASVSATDTHKSASSTFKASVARATGSTTLSETSGTLTYNGTSASSTTKTFTVKCADGTTPTVSSSNTSAATATMSSSANSNGEYTVTATWVGAGSGNNNASSILTVNCPAGEHYAASSATYTLTTAKAACTITLSKTSDTTSYPASKTFTASTNTNGTLDVSPKSGSTEVALASLSNGTVTVTPQKTGTQTVTVSSSATTTYKSCSATYTLTVNNGTITCANTAAGCGNKSQTYNGNALGCSIAASAISPDGTTVEYATKSGSTCGTYSTTAPTSITNVADGKTICYRISKTNYTTLTGEYTCTITRATMNPSASNNSKTYNGNALTCNGATWSNVPSGSTTYYSTDGGTTYNTTAPTRTAAGTQTINWKVTNPNYNDKTGTFTCTVNKADCGVTLSPTTGTVTYPTANTTFTATTASGCTLSVSPTATGTGIKAIASISNGTVTVTPKATGSQVVTVTATADGNHNNSSATYTLTVNNKTININSNGGTGTCAGGSITCSYEAGTCTAPTWNSSACAITNGIKVLTGWNTAANGSGTSVALGGDAKTVTGTLYAVWSADCSCTKGNNVSSCSATGTSSNKCTYSYTCADGYHTSGTFTATNAATAANTSPNCTGNSITVNVDENGGSTVTSPTCTYGGDLVLPSAPSKTGYSFAGWKSANGTVSAASATITNGCISTYTGVTEGTSTGIRAEWTPNNYTVTLNDNTGTGGSGYVYTTYNTNAYKDSARTLVMSTNANAVTVPVHNNNYKFVGYYTSQVDDDGTSLTTNRWIDENGYITAAGIAGLKAVSNNNVVLYARWVSCYPVTFDNVTYCGSNDNIPTLWNRSHLSNWGSGTMMTSYYTTLANCVEMTNNVNAYTPAIPANPKVHSSYIGDFVHYNNGAVPNVMTATGNFSSVADDQWVGDFTWYAHCTCNTGWEGAGSFVAGACTEGVTVTLNDNTGTGGSGNVYTSKTGNSNAGVYKDFNRTTAMTTSANAVAVPTKANHEFLGYFSATTGGTKYIGADGKITSEGLAAGKGYGASDTNKVWYAQWKVLNFDIVLDAGTNGGTFGTSVTSKLYTTYNVNVYNDSARSHAMTSSTYPAAVPTKSHATFNGYYSAATGGSQYTNANGYITTTGLDAGKGYTANATWYAQFDCDTGYHEENTTCVANSYTVKFMTGSDLMGTQSFTYNDSDRLKDIADLANIPVSATYGWDFVGWATTYNTTTTTYGNAAEVNNLTTEEGGDVVLYAVWKRNVLFKYYNSASATSTTTSTPVQYYRNTTATAASVSTVSTYTLYSQSTYKWRPVGWAMASTNATTADVNYDATSVAPAVNDKPEYYAVYSRTSKLVYNGNTNTGGSTSDSSSKQYFNAGGDDAIALDITLASNGFTKTGYGFNKWAAGSASGTQYSAGDSFTFPNIGWSTHPTYTMYATWTANVIDLNWFDEDGTTPASGVSTEAESCTYGNPITLPTNPTKQGYRFTGWTIMDD